MKEKKRRRESVFLALVVIVICLSGAQFATWTRQIEPSTAARPEEMGDYDPEVGIRTFDEGSLSDDVDYEMAFAQRDFQHGTTELVEEGAVREVDDDGYDHYEALVRVKNNTDETLSGMKLFLDLPDSIGERSVVGDAMTVTARLEYKGATARKMLNLMGSNSPIEVVFPGGSAGFIKRGDAEVTDLPAYEDAPMYEEKPSVPLFDYWQNEGFELDIPAGETWFLAIGINAHAVADFEVRSKIVSMDGKYSGKELGSSAIFRKEEQFHVITEITNLTDMEQPVELWPNFDPGVDLIPGSVRLDGQPMDDFTFQERKDGRYFETADLGVNAPHEMMTLEYDVKMRASSKANNTLFVRSVVEVGATSVGTILGSSVYNVIGKFMLLSLVDTVLIAVWYNFIWAKNSWKGAE